MQSMTGYGESRFNIDGVAYAIGIRSLNHKSLEIIIKAPEELNWFVSNAEQLIRKVFLRGRIDVSISTNGQLATTTELNLLVIKKYEEVFQKYYRKKNLSIPPEVIAQLPGVFQSTIPDFRPHGKKIEFQFVRAMLRMERQRKSEGKKLLQILKKKNLLLQRLTRRIQALHNNVRQKQEQQLEGLFLKLLSKKSLNLNGEPQLVNVKNRLQIAKLVYHEARQDILKLIYSDISEELDRLRIHFAEISHILQEKGSNGRKLEFYLQEVLREINTATVKTSENQINKIGIMMKVEIEKLREQVRNLE